jgi:cysteine protease ATG4
MEDLKKPIDSLIKEDDHAGAQIKSNDGFRPLLLFIPLRLGQEKFNVEYAEAIKSCLELKQSVGLIGGKPRHALWFIGYNDNHLLYLDPHKTQNSVPIPSDDQDISDMSYHCSTFDKIHIGELDPSLALVRCVD